MSDDTAPLTWLGRRFIFSMRAYNWLATQIARAWRSLGLGLGETRPATAAAMDGAG